MDQGVTMNVQGMKEIRDMFNQLPKQVNKDAVWGRFWKKNTEPLKEAAAREAPMAKKDIPYPPNKELTIKRGTLKDSIQFFRTRASKGDIHGGYIGPRVKGKFSKNKGGYYGAWVEFGNEVMHFGKFKSKANRIMKRSWFAKKQQVLNDGLKDSKIIFEKEIKKHSRRMDKYGKLGY